MVRNPDISWDGQGEKLLGKKMDGVRGVEVMVRCRLTRSKVGQRAHGVQ